MTSSDTSGRNPPSGFDTVSLDDVLADAMIPDRKGASGEVAAVEALVARCHAASSGEEPPVARDVRRGWRRPAATVLLLGTRFAKVRVEDHGSPMQAAGAHLGLCLLLVYVNLETGTGASWDAVTARDEWPKRTAEYRRWITEAVEAAGGAVEPPTGPIGDFLDEQVKAASKDPRAPRELREFARRIHLRAPQNVSDDLLDEFDSLVGHVEEGSVGYLIEAKPKPGRFYFRRERNRERLVYGGVDLDFSRPNRDQEFVTLSNAQGRLFMKLSRGGGITETERRVRADLQRALHGAGCPIRIVGSMYSLKFDRPPDLDPDLVSWWEQVRRKARRRAPGV